MCVCTGCGYVIGCVVCVVRVVCVCVCLCVLCVCVVCYVWCALD